MKLNHVMLDLETTGTKVGCAPVSIGAVKLCASTLYIDEKNSFYRAIDLESSMRFGLGVSPSTIKWWMQQSEEARAVFNDPNAVGLQQALVEFAEWVAEDGDYSEVQVWGNGAGFDQPILEHAYAVVDIIQPWNHWNARCYRTKRAEAPMVNAPNRVGTHHHALDDALTQARHLCAIWAYEGVTPPVGVLQA